MRTDVVDPAVVAEYTKAGFWDDETIASRVARHAAADPEGVAFVGLDGSPGGGRAEPFVLTWRAYDEASWRLGAALAGLGHARGDTVALWLPDGPLAHVAYVACEKAGLVAVGIGPRSGVRETAHLLRTTGARTLVTAPSHRGERADTLVAALRDAGAPIDRHVVVGATASSLDVRADGAPVPLATAAGATADLAGRALGANELFFLNSTSGTTGLPKTVMHTQNRWKYFHSKCRQFRTDDVFAVVVPNPFGFGLWMAHFSPTMLGAPCVLVEEFDVDGTLDLLEQHRVTVLAAVTTQVLMLLRSPRLDRTDLSALRIVQSGGERVPYGPAAEFEDRTGATILQFYGSNEAGCVCGTTVDDTREKRLGTAGRIFPEMQVRLFDDDGNDVTHTGRGRCACKGPGITTGYLDGPEANAKLFRDDGWMYLGDVVELDADGYLRVVGRTADFIIRGGHNVSAPAVEEEVLAHPHVAMAAVVGMPDEVLGERVCAYVTLRPGTTLDLDALASFLAERGVSKTMWPERLVVVAELPRGSGGKVGKAELRVDIERRLAEEAAARR